MSSYSELIKNFERIRDYMREFYVFGYKSRDGYGKKSLRSYDDERRRMESWLGDHISYARTPEGKRVFISIDSRTSGHNPLYKAWKAKSFTDGDITLHFALFDILYSPEISLTLSEITATVDDYLSGFYKPMMFDESTVRKKLGEYIKEGIIISEKRGRKLYYRRAESYDIRPYRDAIDFFSESAPCGVVGSFLLDRMDEDSEPFNFKHHYITGTVDSGVMAALFDAMQKKSIVSVSNLSRRKDEPRRTRVIPLRIFISVQSGRQFLIAYEPEYNSMKSFRLDYLSRVKIEEVTPRFDELRAALDDMQRNMWGVTVRRNKMGQDFLEHVEFDIKIEDGEDFIINRLEREKRVGRVERLDENTYRFTADVYDTGEMVPWIRTFICRIVRMNFSNRTVENRFKQDILQMYRMYGVEEVEL